MKFRFCGDLDCPEWVLAQVVLLSRLSSLKLKALCVELIKSWLSEPSSDSRSALDLERVAKLLADANLVGDDLRGCVAALEFIVDCSVRYSVAGDVLLAELQQLGLPREHAAALSKVITEHEAARALAARFGRDALAFGADPAADLCEHPVAATRVHLEHVLTSAPFPEFARPVLSLTLTLSTGSGSGAGQLVQVPITLTAEQALVLTSETRRALKQMDSLATAPPHS